MLLMFDGFHNSQFGCCRDAFNLCEDELLKIVKGKFSRASVDFVNFCGTVFYSYCSLILGFL